MSISSMTNVAFSRRVDVETPEPVPTSNSSIVAAAGGTIQTQQGCRRGFAGHYDLPAHRNRSIVHVGIDSD